MGHWSPGRDMVQLSVSKNVYGLNPNSMRDEPSNQSTYWKAGSKSKLFAIVGANICGRLAKC